MGHPALLSKKFIIKSKSAGWGLFQRWAIPFNLGIGTTAPGYTLTVNGTAWCTAGAWASDLRWKENISILNNPLDKLSRLRGVEFDWKRKEFKDKNFPEGRQIGIIAQELEKEFPELVITDKQGYKAIAYDKLTAVLLEAAGTTKAAKPAP